jgi:hypothetical protein
MPFSEFLPEQAPGCLGFGGCFPQSEESGRGIVGIAPGPEIALIVGELHRGDGPTAGVVAVATDTGLAGDIGDFEVRIIERSCHDTMVLYSPPVYHIPSQGLTSAHAP